MVSRGIDAGHDLGPTVYRQVRYELADHPVGRDVATTARQARDWWEARRRGAVPAPA